MANVHIALVGGQTYPVYLGIAETSPDRVMLVHSRSSLAEAQRIAAEFSGTGISFAYELCDPVNVKQVLEKTRMLAEVLSDEDHYTINLTSGTKVWSILFHEAFATKPHVRFIYVDQSCNIYDLSNGDSHPGAPVDTDRVFRLNNTVALSYRDFKELTPEDINAILQLQEMHGANRKAFSRLTIYMPHNHDSDGKTTTEYNGSSLSWDSATNAVNIRIRKSGDSYMEETITAPHIADLVFKSGWFEAEVARHLALWKHSREVRMNVMFPYEAGSTKNEIDVIVNTGSRIVFVECKTSILNVTDLDKFSKAVRNYGGTGCHALFVCSSKMRPEALEKCRDNGIIPFSFKDTIDAANDKTDPDLITKALHQLLDERLFANNKK